MRSRFVTALFAAALTGGIAQSSAEAQGQPPAPEAPAAKPDYAAAKAHYMAAEKAAQAGDWAQAAKSYGAAYEITKDPILFFKLGLAYQESGDCTRAIEYFERFKQEASNAEAFADETARRIEECKANAAAAAATSTETDTTATTGTDTSGETLSPEGAESSAAETTAENPIEPDLDTPLVDDAPTSDASVAIEQPTFIDEEVTWQRTAAWSSVGVSVAFLTAGAVLGLSAQSREEDIDNLFDFRDENGQPAEYDATVDQRYRDLVDEGETLNDMAMVAFGLAGASAAAAVVFFVLDPTSSTESESGLSLSPTVDRDGVGVSAGWSF